MLKKRKFIQKAPEIKCKLTKKRDGNWYGVYELPLSLTEEELEWHLSNTVGSMHLIYKDWQKAGGRMRKHHGELTGRKEKFEKRDKGVAEICKRQIEKGVPKIIIPDIANKHLHKIKSLPKKDELSDRQIRRIFKKGMQQLMRE